VAHVDDIGPVQVAVHQDEEILSGIGAEICCKFLKWPFWSGFDGDGFPRVRWQMFLALLASEDNVVDVVVQPWPVDDESSLCIPVSLAFIWHLILVLCESAAYVYSA